MHLLEEPLSGLRVLQTAPHRDDRGAFTRCYCAETFKMIGIDRPVVQGNLSQNVQEGTLRGLHMQTGSDAEIKIVQCLKGAIFDVGVDMRPGSPTFGRWHGATLSAQNGRMMVLAEGFAHGFITLRPDTLVHYLVTADYAPQSEVGFRYDDPAFGIDWPMTPTVISARDSNHEFIKSLEPA